MRESHDLREAVRDHYARAARQASCCSPAVSDKEATVFGASQYEADQLTGLPAEAVAASIGCANPVAVAELHEGEVVLDLGSGGGIDVLLSARRVGPSGFSYGVDMTAEMLELARTNQARAGVENVEFLHGDLAAIPLPDATVDVVLSNCVLSLAVDKQAVFAEAFRVLRPGGRLAVADVVSDRETPEADGAATDPARWVACIEGAISRSAYREGLEAAGFTDVSVTDSHTVGDGFTSAIVRARKPTT